MNKVSLKNLLLGMFALLSVASYASIKLPAIVSSDMVLQRSTTVTIWGWADAKEKITITASWLADDLEVKADKDGNWKLEVETTDSKEAQSIQLKSEDSDILLDNILFGEVWLCSGQSNMEQPVKGYNAQPTFGYQEALLTANNPNLRLFTVERNSSREPLAEIEKYRPWQAANTSNVAEFSAVAYYFGVQLQSVLDVPVGLIHTSWGGTKVEAWMSKEAIAPIEKADLSDEMFAKRKHNTSTVLYNAMINPVIPFAIKGVLWYQGESNRLTPEKYELCLPAMVADWRARWGVGEFPFYYVQVAPYLYGNNDVYDVKNTAFIREALLHCNSLIPNSGIAITMDLGKATCIHPPKKKEVADRLLFNALSQTYGLKEFDGKSPEYVSSEVRDSSMIVIFNNAEMGLFTYDKLTDFEIAGEDRVFYPAEAELLWKKQSVSVKSDKVPSPVAVRYAWRNWVVGTLFDTNGLPASSFRTDDWDDATHWKSE